MCEDPLLRDPGSTTTFRIAVGVPFQPMLSSKLTLHDGGVGDDEAGGSATGKRARGASGSCGASSGESFFSAGSFGDFFLETKLDGERMQVRTLGR